jgi:parallel beta-helix repeat protein
MSLRTNRLVHQFGIDALESRRLFSTYTVNAAGGANYSDLETAIVNAPAGSTLLVAPGTYTAHPTPLDGAASVFWITKALTIKSTGGPASTKLVVPAGQNQNVLISASNVTLEGFSLLSGNFCLMAQDFLHNTTLSNVLLENLELTPDATDGNGHGILLEQVDHSVVDNCTVGLSYANGIMVDNNSFYDTVMDCTVNGTVTQHGIAVKNSDDDQIVNNTVNESGFDGVILYNASNNQVTGNDLTNFQVDGICLTNTSDSNDIALNTVASTGYAQGRTVGTGIWMNLSSNSNTIFANTVSGSAECGIDIFVSDNNLIDGNNVFDNYEGGIFLYNCPGYTPALGPEPANTVIINNYVHDNTANGAVTLNGATNTDIERNYFSGVYTGVYGSSSDVGLLSENTTNTQFINNTVVNLAAGIAALATTGDLNVYLNRFINVGENYAFAGATIQFDDGSIIGGNYWSNQPAQGDPGWTPYTKFVYNMTGALGGGYEDSNPFGDESLGQPYAVNVTSPAVGTIMAPFSTRAIQWTSTGATLVDIFYSSPQTGDVLIAQNQPDSGVYVWTVPNLPASSDYQIKIAPENSAGQMLGTPAVGGIFSIAAASPLKLLSPPANLITSPGSSITVSWDSTIPGTPVDVQLQTNGGTWTTLASSITDDFASVTLPNVATDQARIRVVEHGTMVGDTQDGFFSISNTASVYTESNQLIGSNQTINWLSPANATMINVAFWNGSTWTPIATDLPNQGSVTWFVPEMATNGSSIQVQFLDSSGNPIASAVSNTFNIQYTLATGAPVPVYRLYNPYIAAQMYTSAINEYNVLGREGWDQIGVVFDAYSGPITLNGVSAVPNYRLYNPTTLQQFWTTSRTTYFNMRSSGAWIAVGIANYEFASQAAGTIPLYRVALGSPPVPNVWTTALNEYDTLASYGWTEEGVDAYVLSA